MDPGEKWKNKNSAYNIPFPCGLTGDVIMWVLVVCYRCVLRLLHPPLLLTLLSCLLERNTNTGRFLLFFFFFYKFLKIIRRECHLAGSMKEASLVWLRVYTRRCSGYLHAQTSLYEEELGPSWLWDVTWNRLCVFVTGHRAAEQTGWLPRVIIFLWHCVAPLVVFAEISAKKPGKHSVFSRLFPRRQSTFLHCNQCRNHRWHLWLGSFLTVLSNVFFLRIFTHRNLILVFDIWTSILLTQRHAFLVSTSLLLFTQETNPWWCRHLRIACRAVGHWCGIGSSAIWSQTGTVTSDLCYCLLINMGQNAQMPGLNVSLLLI